MGIDRRQLLQLLLASAGACTGTGAGLASAPQTRDARRTSVLDAMKRATAFMVDKVSTHGGYVWTYLPDLSRRWGELEARRSMIWIQPPGTPTMGHLFLDAFHTTGDEYYYQAALKAAGALISAQHPSGGWSYLHDFAGERSRREWYATIGRNAWRLEEFQHDWANATFDDGGTAAATTLLLRLVVEQRDGGAKRNAGVRQDADARRDADVKRAFDKAILFMLDSQYRVGAWPQRFPPAPPVPPFSSHRQPDYTSYLTFNDDVAAQNLECLVLCYQALGDRRLLDPIARGMRAFVVTQQPAPQAGWALQYSTDLKPAAARTYEPRALVTHTTARNVELLVKFYRLTGDPAFLARIPEALDWLDAVRLPAGVAPPDRTHPTFVEIGTNQPLYVHRSGSNVVNGRYFVDRNPVKTIGHYSSFRRIDVAALRTLYDEAKAVTAAELAKGSPLAAGAERIVVPRFFVATTGPVPPGVVDGGGDGGADRAGQVIGRLNADGYWPAPLGNTSHPYRGPGSKEIPPGDFAETHVGDASDTSPYRDEKAIGISTAAYIRNMSVLIQALK